MRRRNFAEKKGRKKCIEFDGGKFFGWTWAITVANNKNQGS